MATGRPHSVQSYPGPHARPAGLRSGRYVQAFPEYGPERRRIDWKGEYREVVEPERLAFTVSDQPGDGPWELVTVELVDLGDGRTEMRFEQRGTLPPDVYEGARKGWSTFFDRIDERLAPAR